MDAHGDPTDDAGEAVCWIGQLCPECGAMPEGAGAEDPFVPCWRCGTVRAQIRTADRPDAPDADDGTGV